MQHTYITGVFDTTCLVASYDFLLIWNEGPLFDIVKLLVYLMFSFLMTKNEAAK